MKVWRPSHGPRRYAHYKRDGHSIMVRVLSPGRVLYMTKNYREIDLSFMTAEHNIISKMSVGTELHAELWKPNHPASYISSGIANSDASMFLSVFRVPSLKINELSAVASIVMDQGLQFIPWLQHRTGSDDWANPYCHGSYSDITTVVIPEHCEGFVLKDGNNDLEPLKVKLEQTCDLIVQSIVPGKGKYTGQCGSVVCGTYDGQEIANVAMFTDEIRALITEADIGRVCEVKYQYLGAGGRLRHPRFLRWRDDKNPEDCDGNDIK